MIRVDLETGSQTIVSDFWNIDPPWIESDVLPAGMTIDPNGDLVVAEAWTGDVYRVSLPEGGDPVPLTSGGPFTRPTAVAFLGDGTLVVTDAWGVDKLHKIAPGSTTPIAFATDAPLVSPTDVFALPEPGTVTMLVPGLGLILALGRRRAERRCH